MANISWVNCKDMGIVFSQEAICREDLQKKVKQLAISKNT